MNDKELTDDKTLVEKYIKEKDTNSFGQIYNKYFDDVYSFVYSRVGDRSFTEDIVSETFFALLEVIKSYNKTSSLKNFIIGVSVNKTKQFWAKKYKENSSEFNDNKFFYTDSLEEDNHSSERENKLTQIINQIIPQLKERYRRVLTERFINEKTIKQTALQLNITESNVKVIQNRALKKATEIANTLIINTTKIS